MHSLTIVFLLILTIITPEGAPNKNSTREEPSIEQCLEDAADFLATEVPENNQGIAAKCVKAKVPNVHRDEEQSTPHRSPKKRGEDL